MSIEKSMERRKLEKDEMRASSTQQTDRKTSGRNQSAAASRTGFNALINHRRHLERIDQDNARIYLKLKHK